MSIKPTITNTTERILVYGSTGSGKSNAILSLATKNPDTTFWVLDNDLGITPIIENEFPQLENVRTYFCDSFNEHMEALNDILKQAKAGDWVVIDMMGSLWERAQEKFAEEVFGKGLDDHLIAARKSAADAGTTGGPAFDGLRDWPGITQTHAKIYREILKAAFNKKLHIYATAGSVELLDAGKVKESKQNIETYGGVGYKPKGQKDLGHKFNTILYFEKKGINKWYMTGVKDRGRGSFEREEFTDWAKDYLMGHGNWVVEKKAE